MPADTDQPTLAVLANATLQPGQPPKDRVFYARHHVALKWTPYKPNSQEVKRGKMGRWQELRPYGIGWQNSEVPPEAGAWVEDVLNNPERDTRPNSEPRPAGDLREAALRAIQHSIRQARIPGNDWRRELALIENTVAEALATHSPAPMADPMKVGLAIQSAWGEDDMGFDNTLPPIEFSDAELRHLGAAAIRAVAHPSTQEGGDRG